MKFGIAIAVVLVAAVALAQFQELPPPPTGTQSVVVIHGDAPVFLAPRRGATRRGTLARGARFPLLRRVAGTGCSTRSWAEIEPGVFVCEGDVRPSPLPPSTRAYPVMEGRDLLPHDYGFVATDGTRAYAHPSDYFADQYMEALGEGFGVILTGHTVFDGVPFLRTRRRMWIEAGEVRRARGSEFSGVALEGPLDVGFVKTRSARVHQRRGGRVIRQAGRRTVVHVAQIDRGWAELKNGEWMRARDLAIAQPAPVPDGVPEGGTWIDVDVRRQVLVAYRGETPVYATLVSTGKRRRTHETPPGLHRIWVKLAFSDMDNLEREDLETNYAIERVPWVQYFEGSNGLHAAFWHDDFGRRKSHGCVNLSPQDARALYEFSEPAMPPGWTAIFPRDTDEDEPATYVWVH
ncbi:MAG: L,D-transpeptidase [Myxococcota bacterium]